MAVLVVAAHSARMMAEAAARDGFEVVALDLFGDADTRRAAGDFIVIGEAASLRIEPERVLAALRDVACRPGVVGWVAGSGFEGLPELLEAGAALLPLIGTAPDAVQRVRDPGGFFALLDAHGIGRPALRFLLPDEAAGWLVKNPLGCGGWHIRRAADVAALPPFHYAQREVSGRAMSLTFLGNGSEALPLGFNRLTVRAVAGRPFVFCGVVGPVPVSGVVSRQVQAALRVLTLAFGLRGLCSLDFIVGDMGRVDVLEVNPRPPASMAVYAGLPLMRWHVAACVSGELPDAPSTDTGVWGHRIVFARRAFTLDAAGAAMLAGSADVHDLPGADTRFEAGDPVCSLAVEAPDADAAETALDERCRRLLTLLEKHP